MRGPCGSLAMVPSSAVFEAIAMSRLFLAVTLLLATTTVQAAEPPQRYEAIADGTLIIEPDGRVGEVTLPDALEEPLRSKFLAQMRAWKFRPIVEDGAPVRARAHLVARLFLEEHPDGDGLAAGISEVQFVDPPTAEAKPSGLIPPRYPRALASRGIGGEVVLAVETDAGGKVERVAVRRGRLYVRGDERRAPRDETSFAELVRASERAVLQWTLPNCGGACDVPIRYVVTRVDAKPFWLPVIDIPVTPAPWVPPAADARQLTAAGDAPSTRFELLSPLENGVPN